LINVSMPDCVIGTARSRNVDSGLQNSSRLEYGPAGYWTTGKLPTGRILAPIMPWRALSHLSEGDAQAIAAYLQCLKPAQNQVPGPFGPTQKVTVFVHTVLPANVYNGLRKPPPSPPSK
jgi:hypothetical protein